MGTDEIIRTAVESVSLGAAAIGVLWRAAGRVRDMAKKFDTMQASVYGLHGRMDAFDRNLQSHQKDDCDALEKVDGKLDQITEAHIRIDERVQGVQKIVETNNKAVHDSITDHYNRVTNQIKEEYRNIRESGNDNRRQSR